MDNVEDVITKYLYPICVILWTDAFMPHNMLIKNCTSVHACKLTIRLPNGDHLSNFLYTISLGRKLDDWFHVDQKLVDEIND